ncbi:L-isoaspartate protein carboxylmethyltransferase type II [Candidatus Terasakiella magnetica]|uniref:Protein-L-isoaspartate O-methyltransferase n=1 Tax=Candidatus Terasakiella magnetica TaxID=1867952 RepID=A0A1C3RCH8_9PROT|nr:protein-L-isoaspartate(D-aspartate) O-methyltransferase [Candidatus Terasakiella magnetica]SCA54922.1 L-isoaspartate protein carboxylmethyltransferase type II [Candidatus Terasakiella magnetica]
MSIHAEKIRLLMELRRQGITDTSVLAAIETIPRENFVSESFQDQAYDNIALPIGYSQTLSQPYIVALMSEALQLSDRMKVLEVGTGSGYQALVLAKLCRRLYTIERYKPLFEQAEQRFHDFRQSNIVCRCGDGTLGWPEQAPFDRIMITAAAADVPPELADQLAIGGVMVAPIGEDTSAQWLIRVTRTESGFNVEELEKVRFVPLIPGLPE